MRMTMAKLFSKHSKVYFSSPSEEIPQRCFLKTHVDRHPKKSLAVCFKRTHKNLRLPPSEESEEDASNAFQKNLYLFPSEEVAKKMFR